MRFEVAGAFGSNIPILPTVLAVGTSAAGNGIFRCRDGRLESGLKDLSGL
jgi:hypothetical protein